MLFAQALFADKEGRSRIPPLALAFNRRVRSGTSPDLDTGSFSQGLTLLGSGAIRGMHYDTNFVVDEQLDSSQPGPVIRRAPFGQTLSRTRQLAKNSRSVANSGTSQPLVPVTRDGSSKSRSNAVGLLFAGGYAIHPALVLDARIDQGHTSTSTNCQGFAGITYLLPCRLWPDRKTNHQPPNRSKVLWLHS